MKRSGRLSRGKPLRRTGKLRSVSAKRRKLQAQRRKALELAVRERGPWCEFQGCCQRAVDGHEPLTRARGGDPTDPAGIVLLCRVHHSWVHDHPAQSHALGWLRYSWEAPDG